MSEFTDTGQDNALETTDPAGHVRHRIHRRRRNGRVDDRGAARRKDCSGRTRSSPVTPRGPALAKLEERFGILTTEGQPEAARSADLVCPDDQTAGASGGHAPALRVHSHRGR